MPNISEVAVSKAIKIPSIGADQSVINHQATDAMKQIDSQLRALHERLATLEAAKAETFKYLKGTMSDDQTTPDSNGNIIFKSSNDTVDAFIYSDTVDLKIKNIENVHDFTQYVRRDGTLELTAPWDAGPHKITAAQFESDIATGTAPFPCTSTTVNTNLNADTVDGWHQDQDTRIAASPTFAKVTAGTFESTVATGTAPFAVASTTVNPNLNADLWDGFQFADYLDQAVKTTSSPTFVKVTAATFESTIAPGTAPFTVASTTLVPNLNADRVDGYHFDQSLLVAASPTFAGLTITPGNIVVDTGYVDSKAYYYINGSKVINIDGIRSIAIGQGIVGGADDNALFGANCGRILTGNGNTAFGANAMYRAGIGAVNNVSIGGYSLYYLTAGVFNVALGAFSQYRNATANNNVSMGYNTLRNARDGDNTVVGGIGMQNLVNGSGNTCIGQSVMFDLGIGSSNTVVGYDAGRKIASTSNYNTILGSQAGRGSGAYTASGMVKIGYRAGYNDTNSNTLFIHNDLTGNTGALIYGEFNATVANQIFRVNGAMQLYQDNLFMTWGAAGDCGIKFDTADMVTDFDIQNSGTTDFRIQQNGTDVFSIDNNLNTNIGDGGTTNYSKFAATGDLSFKGTARIDWTKTTANSITLTAGTSASALSDLQTAFDGNFYAITEAAATPGIDLVVDFINVTALNWVMVKSCYEGSSTHSVGIQLYNWSTATWDTWHSDQNGKGDVTTAGGYIMKDQSFFVPDDSNYIGAGGSAGQVRVRFYHTMSGNASHDLYIDVVALYQ